MKRALVSKSYSLAGVDGNHVVLSETAERLEVVLSIQQNDEGGRIATVRLNAEQFAELFGLRYHVELESPEPSTPLIEAVASLSAEPF